MTFVFPQFNCILSEFLRQKYILYEEMSEWKTERTNSFSMESFRLNCC